MRYALVTGSTKGIGKQIGLDLLRKGYFVYFNYAHDVESAQDLQDELDNGSEYIGKFFIMRYDLSDFKEIDRLIFLSRFDNLDIIILNVGITDRAVFGEITLVDWEKVFRTNLTAPFFMIQSLKDRINNNGRIVFISSVSGIVPDATSISYGVSKGAINILVPYLAKEFADRKITVNAIAAGYTKTDWHKDKPQDQLDRIANKTLAKRLAETNEISHAVGCVIDNEYINGQIIRVDGGFGLCK